ncbi:STOREKEEPER protein, partial [Cucurbita argyrosperma subsp. argyrosperma]
MAPKRLVEDLPSAHAFSDSEEESDYETHEEDREIDNLMQNSEDEIDEHTHEDEEEEQQEEQEQAIPSPVIPRRENSLEKDSAFVSDSDSEKTQSSPSASAFTIKPILRKLACGSSKPNKDSHKSSIDCATVKPPFSSCLKRPIENNFQGNESNKKKMKRVMNGEDIEEGKKVCGSGINRLWSEDDEISILQGMIDFQSAKGSDPYTDMSQFLEFIKKNLSVNVSKNQLIDKVRRLKKKYKNNSEKGRNGDDPVFLKQHEHNSFVLSKKIWGNEAKNKPRKHSVKASNSVSISSPRVDVEAAKKETVNNNNVESKILAEEFLSEYPWLKASFMVENGKFCSEGLLRLVRERMPSIGSEKAKELDDKWRMLGENELELYVKKVELVREQCKLILDSMGKAKRAS